MAQLSFTLCGVSFGAVSSANGKYAKGWYAAPVFQIIRYHATGVGGSYVCHAGLIGGIILARVRYVSATPYADFEGDTSTFQDTAANILSPGGKTWTRCLLDPNAAKITRDSIAMGRNIAGQQFMDVTYLFTSDGG